jgi:hypothetical protein
MYSTLSDFSNDLSPHLIPPGPSSPHELRVKMILQIHSECIPSLSYPQLNSEYIQLNLEFTQLNLEYTQQLGVHSVALGVHSFELGIHSLELGVQSVELGLQLVELGLHSGFMLTYPRDKCRVEGPGATDAYLTLQD